MVLTTRKSASSRQWQQQQRQIIHHPSHFQIGAPLFQSGHRAGGGGQTNGGGGTTIGAVVVTDACTETGGGRGSLATGAAVFGGPRGARGLSRDGRAHAARREYDRVGGTGLPGPGRRHGVALCDRGPGRVFVDVHAQPPPTQAAETASVAAAQAPTFRGTGAAAVVVGDLGLTAELLARVRRGHSHYQRRGRATTPRLLPLAARDRFIAPGLSGLPGAPLLWQSLRQGRRARAHDPHRASVGVVATGRRQRRPTEPPPSQSSALDKNKSGTASASSALDSSAHHRQLAMVAREHWKTCLARAAALSKLSDLYVVDENDPATLLGTGQYAHVRAARRRICHRRMGGTTEGTAKSGDDDKDGDKDDDDDDDSGQYDCALKIFDKNKFWRMVVKGRERADTIVRETAVQATLAAQGGRVPSFLKIRGFFETADSIVLELELLEGTDLFQYITSQSVLKEAEAAVILRDILRSLDAMNRIGLAHRDVKPANILMCGEFGKKESLKDVFDDSGAATAAANKAVALSKGPRVKIGDFGMAAFVGVDGHIRGRCGTPGYVAPEIFSAGIYGGYGNKVDVFSAGVTLYVMLCGYEPFYGETDAELVEANKAAEIDFPVDDWGTVSPEAKDLVQQMMKADPTERLDARQALDHPWFSAQLEDGKPSDDDASWLDSRMSIPNEELVWMEGACIVS